MRMPIRVDIDRFLQERNARWERLAELLDKAEQSPERELGPEGMRELLRFYRLTSADLNQARSLTAEPEILERLNALAGRGYRFIYRRRRGGGLRGRAGGAGVGGPRPGRSCHVGGRPRRGGGRPLRVGSFLGLEIPQAFQRHGTSV